MPLHAGEGGEISAFREQHGIQTVGCHQTPCLLLTFAPLTPRDGLHLILHRFQAGDGGRKRRGLVLSTGLYTGRSKSRTGGNRACLQKVASRNHAVSGKKRVSATL